MGDVIQFPKQRKVVDRQTDALNKAFADILMRVERDRRDVLAEQAEKNPIANKKTLVFSGDLRWRFFECGIDRRGIRRKFAWTTTRNAAGYFLSFVEIWDTKKRRGERVKFVASKHRHKMKARALKLYRAFANRKKKV